MLARFARLTAPAAVLLAGFVAATVAAEGDRVGKLATHLADDKDTLLDLAVSHGLGYIEIVAANPGVDPWVPGEGTAILLPSAHLLPEAPRRGIVINLGDMRLYWFREGGDVVSMPLGIGADGYESPRGESRIVRKQQDPSWTPTARMRAANPELPAFLPAGPDNPLGRHALYLAWSAVLIHGTNQPFSIGRRASFGCFRLYPWDAERLFAGVALGTPVTVVDQPVKVGWHAGALYVEAHPTAGQADEMEVGGEFTPADDPEIEERIWWAAGAAVDRVDWKIVRDAVRNRSGAPIRVTRPH